MKKKLTVKQLKKACIENNFILARFKSGVLMGVNTKVAMLGYKRKKYDDYQETCFVSFIPCNFQEYITFKHPYL